MHKLTVAIAAVLSCLVLTCCGSGADLSLNYGETVTEGKWEGALDRKHGRAFVTAYYWDGSEEDCRIEAKTLDGCSVIKYGGFFGRGLPCPFAVSYEGGDIDISAIPADANVKDVTFTLVLDSGIKDVFMKHTDFYYEIKGEDGMSTYYHGLLKIELDKDNETYEIRDGLIYEKSGTEPLFDSVPAVYLQ